MGPTLVAVRRARILVNGDADGAQGWLASRTECRRWVFLLGKAFVLNMLGIPELLDTRGTQMNGINHESGLCAWWNGSIAMQR